MKLAVLSCGIFKKQLTRAVTLSPNDCHLVFLEQQLHETPLRLREQVQRGIAALEAEGGFDAIAVAYGLCGTGICGVRAGSLPLIIPRTDDCMGIFLGSQARYLELFRTGGVYWFHGAWYEQAFLPSASRLETLREEYTARYGGENADYLVETEREALLRYRTALLIHEPDDPPVYRERTRQTAAEFGWAYAETEGSSALLDRLLGGAWAEELFLTVPPGHIVAASGDEHKITAIL